MAKRHKHRSVQGRDERADASTVEDETSNIETPDWATFLGYLGFVAAIVFFMEEKTQFTVGLFLMGLFLFFVMMIQEPLKSAPRMRKKTRRGLAILISLVVIIPYGFHAMPSESYEPAHLHQLSNERLRELEKALANEMRSSQVTFDKKFNENMLRVTKDELEKERITSGLFDDFRGKFYNNYLGRTVAVREELLWRLKINGPEADKEVYENVSPSIAEGRAFSVGLALSGFIGGSDPLTNLAQYLDDLGRRLP